jgi:hypothetical protein
VLQALGLVNGHDLQVVIASGDVGQRVELAQAAGERGEIGRRAGLLELRQFIEEDLGVPEVGLVLDTRGAAEREPDAFDAIAQPAAAAVGERRREDAPEMGEERLS